MAKEFLNGSLQDIIVVAKKYINGEWTEQTLNEYGDTLQVRPYLPLLEKLSIMIKVIGTHLIQDGMVEFAIADIYKDIFYYGILEGYGSIDCSDSTLLTYENYDLLFPIFGSFILSYCKEDFEVLKDMIKDTIGLNNFREVVRIMSSINEDTLRETVTSTANMLNTFKSNESLIEKLNNIAVFNNPSAAALLNELRKKAVEDAKAQENKPIEEIDKKTENINEASTQKITNKKTTAKKKTASITTKKEENISKEEK